MRCLVLLAACHSAAPEHRGRFPTPLVAPAAESDDVVASVDGRPIRASQVATQARAAGQTAKEALQSLVDAEVLAGEAARRGLDADPEAQEAAEAAAVRRLLHTGFETEVTPANVPTSWVRKIYDQNEKTLNHDVEVDVWHILIDARGLDAEKKAQARATAEDIARRAKSVHDLAAFKALADGVPRARYEHVVTERDGWTVREFSHPAFEQLHNPGDVSSVIETKYGYHVMYLVGMVPPRRTTLAEAEPELRKGAFPEFQKPELVRWCERLAGGHEISVHPERLK
jgi:peptidyl-prolyl cis-trans isomerase C